VTDPATTRPPRTPCEAAAPRRITVSTIDDLLAEGDRVAVRYRARGTHTGELFGAAPTGRAVTITGIEIYRVEGSRIAEYWGEADMSALLGAEG
jgi:predicted ester cyclase